MLYLEGRKLDLDQSRTPVPGLTAAESRRRLDIEGFNDLPSADGRSFLRIVGGVLSEPMFALLLGAGAIYLMLGDLTDALMLLVFAAAAISIGVIQETRSERVLDALRDMTSPRALVVRDGVRKRIPGREVVRGDTVVLANGDVVAMTGDCVNDATALKAAHIGITMGSRGTDVAREASSIVLLDDDFASIVRTVRLGRRIYDNLRKAIAYIVAVHVPIAGLALLPLLFGFSLILTPIHIAFLEMVIDPACSIVFEAERDEDDLMGRPPRHHDSTILSAKMASWSIVQGLLAFASVAAVFARGVSRQMPEDELRALVFVSLVLINASLILVNRSFSGSLMAALGRRNVSLWILLSVVVAILAVTLTWRPAMELFRFGPLHLDDLAVSALAGIAILVLLEIVKPVWRTGFRS